MIEAPRLLFISSSMGVGGAERVWANLLPGLSAKNAIIKLVVLNERGELFDLVARAGFECEFLRGGRGALAFRRLPRLIRLGRRFRPDAVISMGASSNALAAIASRALGVPHVLNWHQQLGIPMGTAPRLATMLAARLGSGIVAVSGSNLDDVKALGFPPERFSVAHNGVPGPQTLPTRVRRSEGFEVCLAARLAWMKRVDVFIEAMAILRHSIPDAVGTIMGDGPLRGDLEQLAKRLEAPVRFVGKVTEPMKVMLQSDVLCLTSDYEAAPLVLMEAAACGLPAVTTECGAVRELVVDGVTANVCKPGDAQGVAEALKKLASDPAKREQMGRAARQRWENHQSVEAMVETYWELLTSLSGPPATWSRQT